jgi:hypothetical protein
MRSPSPAPRRPARGKVTLGRQLDGGFPVLSYFLLVLADYGYLLED